MRGHYGKGKPIGKTKKMTAAEKKRLLMLKKKKGKK